jgi:hypothetical protein
VDTAASLVLASSRGFRLWCAVGSGVTLLALAVSVWLGVAVAYSPATVIWVSTETFLVIYLVILARSRVAVTPREFQMRWPRSAAGPSIPWDSVTAVEVRRGLLLEKVQITADRPQVLFAPIRFRHREDPVFDAALAELARRSGCDVRPAQRGHRPRGVLALGALWVAGLALTAAMNAPWNAPSWPWRHEAARLPAVCGAFAGTARTLFSGGERTPDADLLMAGPVARQDGCTWRDGAVDTFSIGLGLTHQVPFHSASAAAGDVFRRTVAGARRPDRTAVPVRGLGDEARRVTGGGLMPSGVDMITRKANVIVTVRLITTRPDVDTTATVERISRSVLARISFA